MSAQRVENMAVGLKLPLIGTAVIALGLGLYIWWATGDPAKVPPRPVPSMYEGAIIDVPITLVTADKQDLACAYAESVQGYHCAFTAPNKPSEVPATDEAGRKKLLAPYMTIDDILFLIPGLFEDPAINERYQDEVPGRVPREKLDRFTAQCKLKLLKQVDGVSTRWNPKNDWQAPKNKVWVGEAFNCQVSEP